MAEAKIVQAHLHEHFRLSRAEPGCLAFHVDPTTDPLVWQLDESFVDQAAFEAHKARTRASEWFSATGALSRNFAVTDA